MSDEKGSNLSGNSIKGLVPLSPDSITAQDFIDQQTKLEEQARQLMPYDPQHCTFHDGSIRQQLFVCLTCQKKNNTLNAICYSCSIQCHSNHELVELFSKRGFSCDCGTHRMKSFGACNLRKNFDALDRPEPTNVYGHNFEGRFCSCDQPYDPLHEDGVMFQCLLGDACNEDWYHEECILGVSRGSIVREKISKSNTKHPQGVNMFDTLEDAHSVNVERQDDMDDEEDDEQGNTLPGLPNQNEVGAFICWKCVEKNRGIMEKIGDMEEVSIKVMRKGEGEHVEEQMEERTGIQTESQAENQVGNQIKEEIRDNVDAETEVDNQKEPQQLQSTDAMSDKPKRPFESETASEQDNSTNKKIKVEENLNSKIEPKTGPINTTFSIFLKPDYHEFFAKSNDPQLLQFITKYPFFIEEEETYEPPTDDDANSSLLDAGTRALNTIPREQAMNGLAAYEAIRSQLTSFLRPFAEKGQVVTEDDVNGFFDKMKEEQSRV